MTEAAKKAWTEANAKVVAIEAERAAITKDIDAERERILEPTRLRYEIAKAELENVVETYGEPISHCEACGAPIFEGEPYRRGGDVDLCAKDAPTYADLKAHPENFRSWSDDSDDHEMTQAEADHIVEAHLRGGGSLEDGVSVV